MQDSSLSNRKEIAIIGGDLRQLYLAIMLSQKGYSVTVYGNHPEFYTLTKENSEYFHTHIHLTDSLSEAIKQNHTLLLPIPISKDGEYINFHSKQEAIRISEFLSMLTHKPIIIGGAIHPKLSSFFLEHSIIFHDLMKLETVAIGNAIATAEGTILEAIKRSQINLHHGNVLVLGFGRCAKILAQKLKALDANVTVAARKPEAIAYAYAYGFRTALLPDILVDLSCYDYIFNTVPVKLMTKEALVTTKPDVTIIDIASAPGGVDFVAAEELGRNAALCLALPGIYAPYASASILLQPILELLT